MDTRVINVVSVKPAPGSPFYVQERHTLAFNLFGQADVGPAMWGNIVTYTPTATFDLLGVVGWGDCDAEYRILVSSIEVGGFRTSPSKRTEQLDYKHAPIVVGVGDTIIVQAKHSLAATVSLKANILGGSNG